MNSVETIYSKIQQLPLSSQGEVLDYIDELLERSAKNGNTAKSVSWVDWVESHSDNTAIVEDTREAIYGEE